MHTAELVHDKGSCDPHAHYVTAVCVNPYKCTCNNHQFGTAGQKFDMDPKTFTLGNMFAMRLHQYGPDISEITNAAIKELTIETELKKLADVWKEQHFDLFKYTKGGMDDRGWILKSKPASFKAMPRSTLIAYLVAAAFKTEKT